LEETLANALEMAEKAYQEGKEKKAGKSILILSSN